MFRFTVLPIILLLPFTAANIETIKIRSDSRPRIIFKEFGFSKSGHISISINSATFSSLQDPSRLAFCILPWDSNLTDPHLHENTGCLLFNFTQLAPPQNSFYQSYPVTHADLYFLYLFNCQPDSRVTMSVTVETYNLDRGHKNYLPLGQFPLPSLHLMFATFYFTFFTVWMNISVTDRKTHFKTHLLMGGLLLMKILGFLCAAMDKQYVKHTGTSHEWDVVFYIFEFGRVIVLCSVIAVIGVSWTVLWPDAGAQLPMMIILNILLLLKVIVDATYKVAVENRPFIKNQEYWYYRYYKDFNPVFFPTVFYVIFSLLCCLFDWRYKSERTVAMNRTKDKIFIFLLYNMFWWLLTSTMLLVPRVLMVYKFQWLYVVIEESATIVSYVGMFCLFRRAVQSDVFFVAGVEEDFDL